MTDLDGIFPITDKEADALHARRWNSGYGWATEWDWWKDGQPYESSQLDSTKHDLHADLTAIRTALPLQIAASAGWNAKADEFNQWETLSAEEQVAEIDAMRAALLAMAECDFPDRMEFQDGDATVILHPNNGASKGLFRKFCRAIATEGNPDVRHR